MRILLAAPILTVLASGAAAQAPQSMRLPWNAPPGQAAAQLERAGFQRQAGAAAYERSGSSMAPRRLAPDTSAATYTRASGAVKESVFLRTRGGQPVQLFYTAVGDSAALQAKIDQAAADATVQFGPGAVSGKARTWGAAGGQQLSLPSRPSRARDEYHLTILYYRP